MDYKLDPPDPIEEDENGDEERGYDPDRENDLREDRRLSFLESFD